MNIAMICETIISDNTQNRPKSVHEDNHRAHTITARICLLIGMSVG